jgi:signal transduction histidine kinase
VSATVLIAGAVGFATLRQQQANLSHRAALGARADGLLTAHALIHYWKEREAVNEFLLRRRRSLLVEITAEEHAFDRALHRFNVDGSRERKLISDAKVANDVFVAEFRRGHYPRSSSIETARAIGRMDRQANLVVGPLHGLLATNAAEVNREVRRASREDARVRELGATAVLLFLLTVGYFLASAIRLYRRNAEQNRELRELDALKDDFVASVSHEFRTPLTSIRGYAELLLDPATGPLNDDQRHFLKTVDRSSMRLLRLVGDLLFIAQLDAASLSLKLVPLALCDVVANAVDAAQPAAEAKSLTLSAEISDQPEVVGDEARLGQLVDNLISNAIKFTPAGSVTVTLRTHDGHAEIAIRDTGIGIPEAEQRRLFERFFRSSAANLHAIQGSGLGLSIAKAIAEGHGGTIDLSSAEGEGSTFRVRLPLGTAASTVRRTRPGLAAVELL